MTIPVYHNLVTPVDNIRKNKSDVINNSLNKSQDYFGALWEYFNLIFSLQKLKFW